MHNSDYVIVHYSNQSNVQLGMHLNKSGNDFTLSIDNMDVHEPFYFTLSNGEGGQYNTEPFDFDDHGTPAPGPSPSPSPSPTPTPTPTPTPIPTPPGGGLSYTYSSAYAPRWWDDLFSYSAYNYR